MSHTTELRAWFDQHVVPSKDLDVEDFAGYGGGGYLYEFEQIIELLAGRVGANLPPAPLPLIEKIGLARLADPEGAIGGFQIEIPIEFPVHTDTHKTYYRTLYLGAFLDWKDTTCDPDATGVEAAWSITEAVADWWQGLLADARRLNEGRIAGEES